MSKRAPVSVEDVSEDEPKSLGEQLALAKSEIENLRQKLADSEAAKLCMGWDLESLCQSLEDVKVQTSRIARVWVGPEPEKFKTHSYLPKPPIRIAATAAELEFADMTAKLQIFCQWLHCHVTVFADLRAEDKLACFNAMIKERKDLGVRRWDGSAHIKVEKVLEKLGLTQEIWDTSFVAHDEAGPKEFDVLEEQTDLLNRISDAYAKTNPPDEDSD